MTCIRCRTTESAGLCCSSHKAALCHGCYRRTHFVEICVEGCSDCTREGLSVALAPRPAEHAEPRTAAGHPAHTPGDSQ
jgi:hypothetical protein